MNSEHIYGDGTVTSKHNVIDDPDKGTTVNLYMQVNIATGEIRNLSQEEWDMTRLPEILRDELFDYYHRYDYDIEDTVKFEKRMQRFYEVYQSRNRKGFTKFGPKT